MDPGPAQPKAEIDLGGHHEGYAERLDRAAHGQTLIEAEHLARYRWIAPQARAKRVLDAGCGTAYGSELLALAGSREVVGVDRAGEILDAVRPRMPEGVKLQTADLTELPFDDGEFDLVVCFEVIEHLEDPETAIAEFARVLGAGGLLALSSPNREVFPEGNPHHVHEYVPEELSESLAARFDFVRLVRQHAWTASGVFEDEVFADRGGTPVAGRFGKLAGMGPGSEIFTIALASDAPLPDLDPTIVLGPAVDQRAAVQHAHDQRKQEQLIAQQAERLAELEQLPAQLENAQDRLAQLPALYAARSELQAIHSSVSWRLTAPLRRLKALFRRGGS